MCFMVLTRHLMRLQSRIETIATNHSVPGKTGLSLDETLAALDRVGRRQVTMLLEMVQAFSDDVDEKAAAEHVRMRAARAWYGPSVSFSTDEDRPSHRR